MKRKRKNRIPKVLRYSNVQKTKKKMNILPIISTVLKNFNPKTLLKNRYSAGHIILYILKGIVIVDYLQNGFTNINVTLIIISVAALVVINYIRSKGGNNGANKEKA